MLGQQCRTIIFSEIIHWSWPHFNLGPYALGASYVLHPYTTKMTMFASALSSTMSASGVIVALQ